MDGENLKFTHFMFNNDFF